MLIAQCSPSLASEHNFETASLSMNIISHLDYFHKWSLGWLVFVGLREVRYTQIDKGQTGSDRSLGEVSSL